MQRFFKRGLLLLLFLLFYLSI